MEPIADEEYQLPCAEALLAGTLALMTGHAQACCEAHRQRMAHKIVENLAQLSEHPILTPQFRTALYNLRGHWQQMQQPRMQPQQDSRLWHEAPGAVQ